MLPAIKGGVGTLIKIAPSGLFTRRFSWNVVSSIQIYLHILKLTGEIAKLLTLLFDETNFSSGTVYSHSLIKCKHYLQISVFIGVSQQLP